MGYAVACCRSILLNMACPPMPCILFADMMPTPESRVTHQMGPLLSTISAMHYQPGRSNSHEHLGERDRYYRAAYPQRLIETDCKWIEKRKIRNISGVCDI